MTCRCAACLRTAARCCRVTGICGWGSTASSTHENENPAANNFAQGVDMPRQTAKPAVSCSPTDEIYVKRLPSGWPSARHACLALVTPTAYRRIIPCSYLAYLACEVCHAMHARLVAPSLAIPLRARLSVSRSAAHGRAHRGEATRPHPLRHPSRRISLGSRWSSARCARTAPDSPLRVVSACDNAYQLINATQSRKPKGLSGSF
jgi:hypothetical protein